MSVAVVTVRGYDPRNPERRGFGREAMPTNREKVSCDG